MSDNTKTIELIERIAKEFPGLVVCQSQEGVEIKYTGGPAGEANAALVGNYTFAALKSGEISESDVKEDCEAFFSSLEPEAK